MGPLLHLRRGDAQAGVPVLGEHRVPERLAAVGVRALADRQVRQVLAERDVRVDRRATRVGHDVARRRRPSAHPLHHGLQVRGRGAAAAADDVHAELGHEALVGVGQLGRREVVVRVAVDDRRQAGVRQARQVRRRVARQVAQVLGHLPRTRGAVEPDDVGSQRGERRERGADLGADQHAARGLHRHLDHERDLAALAGHGPAGADERRLGLQQVVDGLDEQDVDAALDQGGALELVAVAQLGEGGVAERRELGARADRSDHEAGPVGRRVAGGDLAGDAGGGQVQLVGPLGDLVLVQHDGEGAERVGLDGVDADGEERVVEVGDDVGAGGDEHLVAPLERRPAEVVGREVPQLQVRPGGAVEDHDTFGDARRGRGSRCCLSRADPASGDSRRPAAGSAPIGLDRDAARDGRRCRTGRIGEPGPEPDTHKLPPVP